MSDRSYRSSEWMARGFSLIELMAVIGIIGILISLLLPALARVRERAKDLQCQATLRAIGQAAVLHAHDRQGYLPVAGWHHDPNGGVVNPRGLDDEDARKYLYYIDRDQRRPVPVTVALAISLGYRVRLDGREEMEEGMESPDLRKHFRCPSQSEELAGVSQLDGPERWAAPPEISSYVFDEAILGRRESAVWREERPPMGKLTNIARPAVVMLAMDGRPWSLGDFNYVIFEPADSPFPPAHLPTTVVPGDSLMVPDFGPEDTLWDYKMTVERPDSVYGKQLLDYTRHRYRLNVLFVDGHVASVPMTEPGLKTVGVSNGVYR